MSTREPEKPESPKTPFQQIKPRWIAENLGLAGLGFMGGHFLGGAVGGLAAGHPKVQELSPEARRRVVQTFQALGGTGGVGTALALNQLRMVMAERLYQKKMEQKRKEEVEAPKASKVASVMRQRGWR